VVLMIRKTFILWFTPNGSVARVVCVTSYILFPIFFFIVVVDFLVTSYLKK
jgi:hypothetical protein